MPNMATTVLGFVQAVQAAIAQDFEREGRDSTNILRVQQVDLELHTALTQNAEGEQVWSVITLGGNYARSQQQTLSLSWIRRGRALESFVADDLGYQLITGLDALRIGVREWDRVSGKLPFQSAGGKLVFHIAVDEAGNLAVGGFSAGMAHEQTHTVTLTLAPLP